MADQPATLAALLARRAEIEAAVRAAAPRPPAGTVLVARGSSDHVAAGARYLLEIASGRPVGLGSPSLASRYAAQTDFSGYLVIALSQSGQTPEIAHYLSAARIAGAVGIAITNDAASPLAAAADVVVDLAAGPELAVPATKTVTAEMLALTLIAAALGPVAAGDAELQALPAEVATVLADPAPARAAADVLVNATRIVTAARGPLHGAALETALKIEEITGKMVVCYSTADFLHGPIAIAEPGLPVIAFDTPGPTEGDVAELVVRLRRQGCRVLRASPDPDAELPWPTGAPEALAPILAVVRGQQLALALAEALDIDPDRPSGLTKVTAT